MLLRAASRGAVAASAAIGTANLYLQYRCGTVENPPLPTNSDVIVVGAGVVGVTTAYELGKLGYRVRVLESSSSICGAAAASYGNAGTLGVSAKTQPICKSVPTLIRDTLIHDDSSDHTLHSRNKWILPEVVLDPCFWRWALCVARASFSSFDTLDASWRKMNAAAQAAVFDAARDERLTRAADVRADGRLSVTVGAGAAAKPAAVSEPALHAIAPRITAAKATTDDAQGSCEAFTVGLARASAERHGVVFETNRPVRALVPTADGGGVAGVRTADGAELRADAVVVCAGAATAPLLATAGGFAPIMPLLGHSLTAARPTARAPASHIVVAPYALYMTRLGDSLRFTCYGVLAPATPEYTAGSVRRFEDQREPLDDRLAKLVEYVVPDVAGLCDWEGAVAWRGARPLTPDAQPIVGATNRRALYVNSGHSFNGWRESALSAKVLAAHVAGAPPPADVDVSVWSLRRFQPWPD